MKKWILTIFVILNVFILSAQTTEIETLIRSLEQQEVQAIVAKDTVTLLKLWDKGYVVNSPNNSIVFAGKTAVDRPVLKNTRTSFSRNVEQIVI